MAVMLGVLCALPMQGLAAVAGLDPDVEYAVVYEVGKGAESIRPVKIVDLIEVGSRTFVVLALAGYKSKAYVDLDSVRSILPINR